MNLLEKTYFFMLIDRLGYIEVRKTLFSDEEDPTGAKDNYEKNTRRLEFFLILNKNARRQPYLL